MSEYIFHFRYPTVAEKIDRRPMYTYGPYRFMHLMTCTLMLTLAAYCLFIGHYFLVPTFLVSIVLFTLVYHIRVSRRYLRQEIMRELAE